MVKHLTTSMLLALVTLLAATPATAQVEVAPQTPLVNQYIADTYAQRSTAWWDALGRQLTLQLDAPVDQVDPVALQNIIFFANLHGDKVDLQSATPKLMTIYRQHSSEQIRMMALAALHGIGDEGAMQVLMREAAAEDTSRLQRMTLAVLTDFYGPGVVRTGN